MNIENYSIIKDKISNADTIIIGAGAGFNTPEIIHFPFEELTNKLPNAFLIRVNDKFACIPNDIENKALGVQEDINEFIKGVSK